MKKIIAYVLVIAALLAAAAPAFAASLITNNQNDGKSLSTGTYRSNPGSGNTPTVPGSGITPQGVHGDGGWRSGSTGSTGTGTVPSSSSSGFGGGGGRSFTPNPSSQTGRNGSQTTATTTTVSVGGKQYKECTYTSGGSSYSYMVEVTPTRTSSRSASPSRSSSSSSSSSGGGGSYGNSSVSDFYAAGGDEGSTVGSSCYDYTVDVSAPDYAIAEAGPSVMRKGYQALVYVNVKNIGKLTGKANVSVKINGEVIGDMTTITIPAGGTHTISYGHYTPRTTGKIQMEVIVNPNHPTSTAPRTTTVNSCYGGGYTLEYGSKGELSPAEYSYSNNKLTQNILISKYPEVPIVTVDAPRPPSLSAFLSELPEIEVSPIKDWPDPPQGGGTPGVLTPGGGDPVPIGNNKTQVTWIDSKPTGSDVTYYGKQEMTVKVLDRGAEMTTSKSGYGFELQVEVKVSTDYPTAEKITAPKKVILYLPDAGDYETAVELVRTDNNGSHVPARGTLKTTWELPVNAKSGTEAKKWYIPEWWADASDYSFLVKAKGTYTPGGEISSAAKKVIRVDSNMYTDDYTPGG